MSSKGISWKSSWKARVRIAILNFNEGHRWKVGAHDLLAAQAGWPALLPGLRPTAGGRRSRLRRLERDMMRISRTRSGAPGQLGEGGACEGQG
jgi:hypothetical protein